MSSKQKIIFFLDFDGTLSPITQDPKDAILPADIKARLRKLSVRKNIKLGIVTGRSLKDIRRRVGLKNVIYAANHGMEIYYKGRYLLKRGRNLRRPIRLLAMKLRNSLSDISGVIVEDKGPSVAVHFRKVNPRLRAQVKRVTQRLAGPYTKKHDLQLTSGKMILEARPAKAWNKGKAVLWMWHKLCPEYTPVYIGDDTTDEDAFKAIKPYGPTVRIGKKKHSHAKYFANSIRRILDRISLSLNVD